MVRENGQAVSPETDGGPHKAARSRPPVIRGYIIRKSLRTSDLEAIHVFDCSGLVLPLGGGSATKLY